MADTGVPPTEVPRDGTVDEAILILGLWPGKSRGDDGQLDVILHVGIDQHRS